MKKLAIFLLIATFVSMGAGCTGSQSATLKTVELNIWRMFDDDDTFETIINNYRALHPNVKINYSKLRYDEYEDELIQAFAEGRGPDILSLHNTWLPAYQPLLEPMPKSVTLSYQETQGTLRKETVVVSKTENTMSERELEASFVEQVKDDVVLSYQADPDIDPVKKIYGLPMSLDTLALFYNKNLFNNVGIATPPTTWKELQNDVVALTTYDKNGNIEQSGVALGTSQNVERASDIVSLLMMQNGTQMTDERDRITFDKIPKGTQEGKYPSFDAVSFYTEFADPTKEVYSWSDNFNSSFESFANGETAMFLGYSYHIPLIRTVSPKLNFGISQAPQIATAKEVNYANYWIECVAKSSQNSDWAWDFVQFATSEEQVGSYLKSAQKPTALRNLIASQIDDSLLGAFAVQTLTAQSWYHGYDANVMEDIFEDMIDTVLAGTYEDTSDVMSNASAQVSTTYKQ